MKEGSLFCFVVTRSTQLGCFRSHSWCPWKALDVEGCNGLGSKTFGFWKENSIENVVTLGPMAQATLVCIKLTSFFPTCSKSQNQCFACKCKIVVFLRVISSCVNVNHVHLHTKVFTFTLHVMYILGFTIHLHSIHVYIC
jgi:hypothetical protein